MTSQKTKKTWHFHTLKGFYLFTSGDHYRTHKMFITNTKDKRLSDTVDLMHRSITHPVITYEYQVINALARFAKSVDKMTGKNTALTKTNGVNMKDLQSLANAAARITVAHSKIAEQRAPPEISQP